MRLTTLLLLLTIPLLAPVLAPVLAPLPADEPRIELRAVATGLDLPVAITHAGDSRLFVTLQRGRIVIVDAAGVRDFLDIQSIVNCCGERGLLSVAFHPRYAENRFFYVYYTDAVGDIVIARYRTSSDPERADPASRAQILEIDHSDASNHNGGQLQFGPDGYLYIGTGDGGGMGDQFNNGQDLGSLLAKMLRIDIDSGLPYAVPPSNPFVSTGGAHREIWAFGLRNPWRFSFDRETGDLWIGDVGQALWEEVNLQRVTSRGGENYGWPRMEGTHCFRPQSGCNDGTLTLPVIEYSQIGEPCSVTGGYRYRGTANPRLRGAYIYADLCTGLISAAREQLDGTWVSSPLIDTNLSITSFGEDANGEIYVAHHGGTVFQLVDTAPVFPRRRAVRP